MSPVNRFKKIVVFALLGISANARALILYDAASNDNAKNVIDPANAATYPTSTAVGVPWQYVVRYGINNASAVYIGHGFLLTARHVGTSDTGLLIQGTSYNRDTSFAPLPITIPGSPTVLVDLQLQKVSGDPGLAALPLANVLSSVDTSKASVLIGWGVGKGTVIPGQGWNWGDDSTRAFRWGTNTTSFSTPTMTYLIGGTAMNYTALNVAFNSNKGGTEAAATMGDSGSALFQSLSGTWTLCGTTTVVSTLNSSSYNVDQAYFVRLHDYSWVLRYDAWKAKYGIAQATADSDDSDGDGIPLLLEYALGLNPTAASADGLPVGSVEGPDLVLTFTRLASATDIKVEVESTYNLQAGDWAVEPASLTVLDGTTVFQKVKASVPLGTGDRKFARLKVTKL